MRRLLRPLWILLALVFLFEAWLWDRLAPVVARLVARIPWKAFKAKVASWIEHLPPYAAFFVFLVPIVTLLPFKFLGLWLLARGSWFASLTILVLAKIASMGMAAFIFDITRPKLLQLSWFRRFYDHVIAGIAWAHALIDPIKVEIRAWLRRQLAPARHRLHSLIWLLKPKRTGKFLRRLVRLRRRMNRRPQAA